MTTNQRFYLNEDRDIIDRLNPTAKYRVLYCWEGAPEDDMHLREQVLWRRLYDLVVDLIFNRDPRKEPPIDDFVAMTTKESEEWERNYKARDSISETLFDAIIASHLNTLDVALSIRHRFGGELKREKLGCQDSTSLSLFVDDVECLLRDLYGELDNEAIDRMRRAVLRIVEEFTSYSRKDLWGEYRHAVAIDYIDGIGLAKGDGILSSDVRRMFRAYHDLEVRARAVRVNPAAFSKYTVGFVNELFAVWRCLAEPTQQPSF
jgi:hypothetical protein